MTDNDIIKALEQCTTVGCSTSCPMFDNGYDSTSKCWYALLSKSLSIITHQKAEIERLQDDLDVVNHTIAYFKSKAIKEFAERLKNHFNDGDGVLYEHFLVHYQIDNLVKEMVGED